MYRLRLRKNSAYTKAIRMSFFQKFIKPFSGNATSGEESRLEEYEQIFDLARKKYLTSEKKAELESLYAQLLTKSDDVASGQLQFLGLDKIKEKMGAKWPRLQSLVHKTAEEVINQYVTSHDIYFLYKEDRFVIIFTQSTLDEIHDKVAMISNEIMQRLALLDEDELKTLEIRQEVKKLEAGSFLDEEFPDMLDYIFRQYNPMESKPANSVINDVQSITLNYLYKPLWSTEKNAVNSFLCLTRGDGDDTNDYRAYKAIFKNRPLAEKTALDIRVLEKVIADYNPENHQGKKMYLLCPVQHETVYNFGSYEEYRTACQNIPASLRQSLIFLVTNSEHYSMPAKDTYWFISLLKNFCANIFIDLPMKEHINFTSLKNSGADGLGFRLDQFYNDEEESFRLLKAFIAKAQAFKFKNNFILDIPSELITRKLIEMGFNYLSGPVIGGNIAIPEKGIRSPNEDILKKQ